jgi:hypothetical protein
MKMMKKVLALFGLIPGGLLCFIGGYNALITLLDQIFSDFIDFTNFSIANLFNPFTSVGGSGTFLDSIVAGPGASGGSAVRYWLYMIYGLIAAIGFALVKTCWAALKK